MRSIHHLLFLTLAVILYVRFTAALPYTAENIERDGLSKNRDIILPRSTDTIGSHEKEKRFIGIFIPIAAAIVEGASVVVEAAAFKLWAVGGAIQAMGLGAGLEQGIVGLIGSYGRVFLVESGLKIKRHSTVEGSPLIFGHVQFPTSNRHLTHIEVHVPGAQSNVPLITAMTAVHSNDSFIHVATTWANDTARHTLHYRRAPESVLGRPNTNNSYHQLQSRPYTSRTTTKREEVNEDGVVTDYLWRNGDQSIWEGMTESSGDFSDLAASALTSYMLETNSEASCATFVANNNGAMTAENDGVLAFGWNNQPFGFNGRSAGWLDECEV